MLTLEGRVVASRMLLPVRVFTHGRAVAARGIPRLRADVVLLLDTGATGSTVEASVLRGLGDDPSGSTSVRTSMGVREYRATYLVQFSVAMLDVGGHEVYSPLHPINAISAPDGSYPPGQHGVLGVDFLQHFRLIYDGPGKSYTLSWLEL